MMRTVGQRMGLEIKECHFVSEIETFSPDFVIVMSQLLPKLTRFPTFSNALNPLYYSLLRQGQGIRNILTYDGFTVCCDTIGQYIEALLVRSYRRDPIWFFHNTGARYLASAELNLQNPKLVYFGTNWDKRNRQLFRKLSHQPYMEFYGPNRAWDFVNPKAYCGSVGFGEREILDVYRRAGVGLCLFNDLFVYDDVVSSRLFETVASGAVAICTRMPFIEKFFGNQVLYIDPYISPEKSVEQIDQHMTWIRTHGDAARQMAQEAQKIFSEKLAMEVLLAQLTENFKLWQDEQQKPQEQSIAVLLPGTDVESLTKRLRQLEQQSYSAIVPIVMDNTVELPEGLAPRFGTLRRAPDSLAALSEDYLSVLDDDVELDNNHFYQLMAFMNRYRTRMQGSCLALSACRMAVTEPIAYTESLSESWRTTPYEQMPDGHLSLPRNLIPASGFLAPAHATRALRDAVSSGRQILDSLLACLPPAFSFQATMAWRKANAEAESGLVVITSNRLEIAPRQYPESELSHLAGVFNRLQTLAVNLWFYLRHRGPRETVVTIVKRLRSQT